MLLECFGVSYRFWYSRKDILFMFRNFELVELGPYGYTLPHVSPKGHAKTVLWYLWLITARKMAAKSRSSPIFDQGK